MIVQSKIKSLLNSLPQSQQKFAACALIDVAITTASLGSEDRDRLLEHLRILRKSLLGDVEVTSIAAIWQSIHTTFGISNGDLFSIPNPADLVLLGVLYCFKSELTAANVIHRDLHRPSLLDIWKSSTKSICDSLLDCAPSAIDKESSSSRRERLEAAYKLQWESLIRADNPHE
jgi:hypothetical protein